MILSCPVCTTRFLVAEGAIGPNGRRVRCANCGHVWKESPEMGLDEALFGQEKAADDFMEEVEEDDDLSFLQAGHEAEEDDFQSILRKEIEQTPIPEGVRPVQEDEYDPILAQLKPQPKKSKKQKMPAERVSGFVTAAVVWLVFFGVLLTMQPQISRAWPPSNLLYGIVGMKPVLPGEGFSLDSLSAKMVDGKIVMTGKIINLKSSDNKVPAIMASIVDKDGKVIDTVLIPPPQKTAKAESELPFDASYPNVPDGAANVTYAFSLMSPKSDMSAKQVTPEKVSESVPAKTLPEMAPPKQDSVPEAVPAPSEPAPVLQAETSAAVTTEPAPAQTAPPAVAPQAGTPLDLSAPIPRHVTP